MNAYEIEKERSDSGRRSWATNETSRRAMVANRRRDTTPELRLRSALHGRGLRYRCDLRIDLHELRVRPDVVFTRRKIAVFVDGCYWHGCPEHGATPQSNREYWLAKIARNQERDRRADHALRGAGWTVVRVWEHDDPEMAAERVVAAAAGVPEPAA